MTTQQYCEKTQDSPKQLIWRFNGGEQFTAEDIEAINVLTFKLFQLCSVTKVISRRDADIVHVNCDFNSMFKKVGAYELKTSWNK